MTMRDSVVLDAGARDVAARRLLCGWLWSAPGAWRMMLPGSSGRNRMHGVLSSGVKFIDYSNQTQNRGLSSGVRYFNTKVYPSRVFDPEYALIENPSLPNIWSELGIIVEKGYPDWDFYFQFGTIFWSKS